MAPHKRFAHRSYIVFVSIAFFLLIFGAMVSSGSLGLTWDTIKDFYQNNRLFSLLPTSKKTIDMKNDQRELVKVVSEESVVINVVDNVSPSVVTIGISTTARIGGDIQFDPFDLLEEVHQHKKRLSRISDQDLLLVPKGSL